MYPPDAATFQKKDFKHVCLAVLLPAALLSVGAAVEAQPSRARQATSDLTVEITGIQNTRGEVCVSLFAGSAGFPDNEESIVEKQCITAVETNPETASPADSPADSQADEDATAKPASELAEIPGPVMENIIEGLANNASSPEMGTDTSNTTATETNGTTNALDDDIVITQAVLAITFADLEPGTYAVSVLHDENEDGELNTGTFGIPAEGFGFSKNPEIRTGAPAFSEAAIVVVGAEATTQVELIYY